MKIIIKDSGGYTYKGVFVLFNANEMWWEVKKRLVGIKVQDEVFIKSVGTLNFDFQKVEEHELVPHNADKKYVTAVCCLYGMSLYKCNNVYISFIIY
jgi:hypothetical protein